jgi:hypothetical protein
MERVLRKRNGLIRFGRGIPIKNSKGQIPGGIAVSAASKEDDVL